MRETASYKEPVQVSVTTWAGSFIFRGREMIAETVTAAVLLFGYLDTDGEIVLLPEYGSVYFSSKWECEDTICHEAVIETWREEIGDNFVLFCAPVKEKK